MNGLDDKAVKELYKQRRKKQLLVIIPIIPMIIFAIIQTLHKEGSIVLPFRIVRLIHDERIYMFFFAIVIAILIFSFKNWRCPRCNKYLGKNANPKFCPNCGAEFH